jgi:hypothetical protein
MIDYEDFDVEYITIELRYDPAFMLWDRSGAIWTQLRSQYPELRNQSATPVQQVFETPQTRATVELEKFFVQCRGSDAEEKSAEVAQAMLEACSEHLRLSILTRIGFREIRTHKFDGPEEALAAAGRAAPSQFAGNLLPSNKPLLFTSGMKQEGEKSGLGTYIKGEEREIKLGFPWELAHRFNNEKIKEYVLSLDSDYYTVGMTPRSALDIGEWAKQASRSIRKHWKTVLL